MSARYPGGQWMRRTAWFVLIWVASVLALGAAALLIRAAMSLSGLGKL